MVGMDIRRALPADLPAVAAIYEREAREGHATFDVDGRPMRLWEEKLAADDHFLVAEHGGTVVGYASAAPCRPKPALALHRACGFEQVGVMRQVGRTFDRWIDLAWLQRVLA